MLLDKVKDSRGREWYIQQTIAHGWSRAVLEHQIESGLHERNT
jgi:predicted nuclease of restriction endonuclease-like (RecB) superfamily